ncbi:MAG TPA: zinc ABC transporter substrate-binding protein [Patescibacteria group bacterium]|nr:zinc ABC transporter substrate-binding protein [Patescibacteria group bacterium]
MVNRSNLYLWILGILLLSLFTFGVLSSSNINSSYHKLPLKVVAAENFWGSIASQIGGSKVQVSSIVTDPNSDPHEFESSNSTARIFNSADYVIVNGSSYDSWANNLLRADTNKSVPVLNISNLLNKKNEDNPHFWYNPDYVNKVSLKIKDDLINIDSKDKTYFNAQYQHLISSFSLYQNRIKKIKNKYGGIKVASTEDIFVYLAQAANLNLVSPPSFIKAISEGIDPSSSSNILFEQQLRSGRVNILVYNQQTVTPLTSNLKMLAKDNNIPVVGITETIQPTNLTFQDWMNNEVSNLENALNISSGKL